MILLPCNNCSRAPTCGLRQEKRQHLRGLGFTSVRFVCPILKEEFRPGRRVKTLLKVYENNGYEADEIEAAFVGTVMAFKDRKLLVCLDSQENADGYSANKPIVKIWPKYVQPIDEPDRRTCEVCSLPEGTAIKDWHCGCQPNQSFGDF